MTQTKVRPETDTTPSPAPSCDVAPQNEDRVEVSYPNTIRRRSWWRPFTAIELALAAFAIINAGLGLGAFLIDTLAGALIAGEAPSMEGGMEFTPSMFLALNLSWALMIPVSLGIHAWLYGSARDLLSVVGGFRWPLVRRALMFAVPVWAAYAAVGLLAAPTLQFPSGRDLLVFIIVVLTTPLQAAGEEFVFRGLVNRSAASWVSRPGMGMVLGAVVSSAAFASMHMAFQPYLIQYYFVFGAALAVVAWRTGGIEVPVVIHAVHNTCVFAISMFAGGGTLEELANRSTADVGPEMLGPSLFMILVAAVVWVVTAVRPVRRTQSLPARSA